MNLHNTFKRWIHSLEKTEGDRAVASLHNLLRDGTDEEKVQKLRGETETIWVAVHPTDNVLLFLHHVTVVGGTRTVPDVSIRALVGDGPVAYPILLTTAQAVEYQNVVTAAAWSNVKDLDSAEALTNAPAGQSDCAFPKLFPLPPSLACAVVDEPDRAPAALMRPVRSAVASYDIGKAADAQSFETDLHVRSFARWLWAAHNGHIGSLPLFPSTVPEVVGWADGIHHSTITGAGGGGAAAGAAAGAGAGAAGAAAAGGAAGAAAGGTAAAAAGGAAAGVAVGGAAGPDPIAAALHGVANELKINRLSKEASAAKSKPGIASFPAPIQRLIKFASQSVTKNGTVMGDIPTSAKEFFSQQSASHANLFLAAETFGSMYTIEAQDKSGLATRLHKGSFKYASPGVPSGLTVFACAPGNVMADSGAEAAVSLALAASEGSGLSDTQQKALLNQSLSYPRRYEAAKKQVTLFAAILLMLFGQSELQLYVDSWVVHMNDNESAYDHLISMDPRFFLKMFYMIDMTVQVFLTSCEQQTDRKKVPDELFECADYKRKILLRQCPFNTPEQFQDPGAQQEAAQEEDSPKKKKAKRSGSPKRDDRVKIVNNNSVAALRVHAQNFQNKYGRSCPNYNKRPNIRGCAMCVPFHLLGYCFEGCPEEASHVKLNATEESQAKGYVDKCQA